MKTIYNCHCHLFTDKHLPDNYIGKYLIPIVRNKHVNRGLKWTLKHANPLGKGKMHYLESFLSATFESQEEKLSTLVNYYPSYTKYIVLPMDMGLMQRKHWLTRKAKTGKIKEGIDAQHQDLIELCKKSEYKDKVIPFAHIDPRRPDALQRLTTLVEQHNFKGVKIYPPLGYRPSHERLMKEIYPFMVAHNLPLIAHCSPGSVFTHEIPKKEAHGFAHPSEYIAVMEAFPDLRISLAHFGGIDEWRRYFDKAPNDEDTWVEVIADMMKSGKYPNLYTDISYTIFDVKENLPLLIVLLQDPLIRQHVLFGSDFFMVENHKYSEKRLSIDLRAGLGEPLFWQIANTNPERFLQGEAVLDIDSILTTTQATTSV